MILVSLLKQIGAPGSIRLLLIGTLAGLCFGRVWPRNWRFARIWLLSLYSGYLILAIPLVAHQIDRPFIDPQAGRQKPTERIDTLVVFDGDNAPSRVNETRRLWSLTHPAVVIVSGEPWFFTRIVKAGIPSNRLVRDERSSNTREQVAYVERYMDGHPGAAVAIVASRLQMPRLASLIHRSGRTVALYAAPADREPVSSGWRALIPTYGSLCVSRDALYERAALFQYRRRGWIDSPTGL